MVHAAPGDCPTSDSSKNQVSCDVNTLHGDLSCFTDNPPGDVGPLGDDGSPGSAIGNVEIRSKYKRLLGSPVNIDPKPEELDGLG